MPKNVTARFALATALFSGAMLIGVGCGGGSSEQSGTKTTTEGATQSDSEFCKAIDDYRVSKDLNVNGEFDPFVENAALVKKLETIAPAELEDDLKIVNNYVSQRLDLRYKPTALKKLDTEANTPELQEATKNLLQYSTDECGITLSLT